MGNKMPRPPGASVVSGWPDPCSGRAPLACRGCPLAAPSAAFPGQEGGGGRLVLLGTLVLSGQACLPDLTQPPLLARRPRLPAQPSGAHHAWTWGHAACGAPGRASREPWCAGVRASAALRDTLRALPPGGLQGALSPDTPRAAALHPASRHHGHDRSHSLHPCPEGPLSLTVQRLHLFKNLIDFPGLYHLFVTWDFHLRHTWTPWTLQPPGPGAPLPRRPAPNCRLPNHNAAPAPLAPGSVWAVLLRRPQWWHFSAESPVWAHSDHRQEPRHAGLCHHLWVRFCCAHQTQACEATCPEPGPTGPAHRGPLPAPQPDAHQDPTGPNAQEQVLPLRSGPAGSLAKELEGPTGSFSAGWWN